MGFIGKILVLLHGAVAITVLTWSVGVVTQRIDWNTPPVVEGSKDRGPGLYKRQEARAADFNGSVDRAYNRWTTNVNQVLVLEAERYPRRSFYTAHLYMIQNGKKQDGTVVADPVQDIFPLAANGFLDVPILPNGQLDLARATARKAVEVRPGVKAWSITEYDTRMAKLLEDIKASQKKSTDALVERDKLNREIVGVTQPTLVKGLRQLINEQKLIFDQAEAEDRYATVFVTNREAEFGLFKKRRDSMLGRVDEINKWIAAGKPEVKTSTQDK